MAVYSTIFEDQKIIELSSKYKNVLLLGCGGCANESLAFVNNKPLYVVSEEEELDVAIKKSIAIPYSVKEECERIKHLLEANGHFVVSSLIPLSQNTLCIRHDGDKYNINPKSQFVPDVILTISCSAGAFGVYEDIGKSIPVYSIMQSRGQLAYYYKDTFDKREIIYEKSTVIYEESYNDKEL